MKISQLTAATLIPATVAGVVLTAMPFATASAAPTTHRAPRHVVERAAPAKAVQAARAVKPGKVTEQARATEPAKAAAKTAATARAQTPARPQAQAAPQARAAAPSQPVTAGMSSFERCVAWRESGDNPTASSAGLFGILPATWQQLGYSGTAGQASVAQQKLAFQRLYAQLGTSPWAPYDGC